MAEKDIKKLSDDELENFAGGYGQDPMMYSVYLYVPPSREIVTRVVVKACCPAEAEKKALARVLSLNNSPNRFEAGNLLWLSAFSIFLTKPIGFVCVYRKGSL